MSAVAYQDFISRKARRHSGQSIEVRNLPSVLFDFQKPVVRFGLRKGRSALFGGTGTGKTPMQLAWSMNIPGRVLILAPLGVVGQTILEAKKLFDLEISRPFDGMGEGIFITNYDQLKNWEHVDFDGVVLDESSILKSHDGQTRNYIQNRFADTPYKLACTATPAPNDYMELGTHAEFVGAMTRQEMLATFFTHDGGDTSQWRLKKHARSEFWKWVASWACVFSHPRDLGFDTPGYDLPPLTFHDHIIQTQSEIGGGLFGDGSINATNVYSALRESAPDRTEKVWQLINSEPSEPWGVWCNTNEEQDLLENLLPTFASVRGNDSNDDKEDRLLGFATGKYPGLTTKPKIGAFGMNYQHCARVAICGLTFSFEQVYQLVRRYWRFGQLRPVDVHIVTCSALDSVKSSVAAKNNAFNEMAREIAKYCQQEIL